MNTRFLETVWAMVLTFVCIAQGPSPMAAQGGWKLIWSDEFNSPPLNDASWNVVDWPAGYVNGEAQRYVPGHDQTGKNIWIQDSCLVIEARRESDGSITSGRVNSQNKRSWKYAKFECRAKLPPGAGTWPAIWSMPDNSPYGGWPSCGEVDIMEFFGMVPDQVQFSIHCNKYNHTAGTQKHAYLDLAGVCTGFHTYAMEWYADSICGFADGKKYFSFSNEHSGWQAWPFDQNFHWILNLAMGGANFGGPIGATTLPCRLYIDYVRVYQWDPTVGTTEPLSKPVQYGIRQTARHIEMTLPAVGQFSAQLAALDGRIVARQTGIGLRAYINIAELSRGVYELRVSRAAAGTLSRRIVIR